MPLSTLDNPLLIAMIAVACVGLPLLGSLRPDKVSFLPSMRYYAGNWATTQWLFRKGSGAERRLDERIAKPARLVGEQVAKIYDDPELAEYLLNKGLAFRAMHSHGRALNALLPHAVDDVEAYDCARGRADLQRRQRLELRRRPLPRAAAARGGAGALRVRAGRGAGDRAGVRAAAGAERGRQRYRIHDAATGLVEEGSIAVADMVEPPALARRSASSSRWR